MLKRREDGLKLISINWNSKVSTKSAINTQNGHKRQQNGVWKWDTNFKEAIKGKETKKGQNTSKSSFNFDDHLHCIWIFPKLLIAFLGALHSVEIYYLWNIS